MNYDLENLDELPLYPAGWSAGRLGFDAAEDFWKRVLDVTEEGGLGGHVDEMLEGRSAPRVWLLLHEPGQGALSAAAALGLARQLTGRQMATLILDADEAESTLTKWIGKEEAEGWIDMIRYGSSVLANGEPLPFPGRTGYTLGIGSFTPTDATNEEIGQLLGRLRRQADDILVVAQADELGRRWAAAAQIRLFCWDREQRSRGVVEALAATLSQLGCPLTGLVGFGLAEEPAAVTVAADGETETTADAADEAPAAVGDEDAVVPDGDMATGDAQEDVIDDEVDDEDAADVSVYAETDEEEIANLHPEPELAGRKSSSGIFWGIAVVSVVVICALGIYWVKFLRIPPEGNFTLSAVQADAGTQSAALDLQDRAPVDVDGDGTAADDRDDPVNPSQQTPAEDATGNGSTETSGAGSEPALQPEMAETTPPADTSQPRQDETLDPAPAGTPGETAADDTPPVPVFDMAPYLVNVGEAGYALHVYSFADSTQARVQQLRLERLGIQSVTRTVQMKSGRWWRIYVGSFTTRSAANEAKPALLDKLRETWAQTVDFR